MSAKAAPQIQKSATPIPPVVTYTGLGNVRAFTDETTTLEQESSTTDSQVAAAPPPPDKPLNQTANSAYNFSRISVTDYVPATVQTKLVVGAPGDKYEQEADAMADKVMSMTPSVQKQEEPIEKEPEVQTKPLPETVQQKQEEDGTVHLKSLTETIQRKSEEDGILHLQPLAETVQQKQEEDGTVHLKSLTETIQRKSEEEGTVHLKPLTETIQRKEIEGVVHLKPLLNQVSPVIQQTLKHSTLISRKGDGGFTATDSIETRLKSGKGGGQPLPNETRDFMESRFGNDFSSVNVHTGSDAVQLSKELGAQAFTHGEDVYFNSGKYSPHTDEGKKLLAHELTHTIQQTGPKIKKKPLKTAQKLNQIQRQSKALAKPDSASVSQPISQLKGAGKLQAQPDEKKDEKDSAKSTEASDKDKQKPEDKNQGSPGANSGEGKQPQAGSAGGTSDANVQGGNSADVAGGTGVATDGNTASNAGGAAEGNPSAAAVVTPIAVVQDPNQKAPDSPEADPAFQAVIKQTEGVSTQYTQHPAPGTKAAEAQQAAVDPKKQERDAQTTKVEQTSQQKTKAFDRASFEKAILDKVGIAVPKNLEQADNFSKNNKLGEVKGQLTQQVEQNKQEAAGGLPQANKTEPNPSAEQPKPVAPIPDINQDVGKQQQTVEADKAVPKEKSEKEIEKPLETTAENLDQTFGTIQPKLVVGAPGDKYEQEADRMAERVMAMPEESATNEIESNSATAEFQPQIQNQAESTSPEINTEGEQLLASSIQRVQLFIQRKEAIEAQPVEQPDKQVPLNQERLGTWGEAGGSQAITALKDAKKNTTEGAKQYRQEEEGQLTTAKGEAVGEADKSNQEMFGDRDASMKQVGASQEQTKTEDEIKREKVAADIDKIYKQTKDSVDTRLKKLDDDVNKEFERGSQAAKQKFEGYVKQRMDAYKNERYSGFWGPGKWLKDKFLGMPDEVNKFYEEGKQVYIDEMKKSVSKIATIVETGLNEAKALVDQGRQQVNDYVQSLPEDLKQVGAESAAKIQSQFDSLEQSVKDKQNQLVDSLAQKYQAELQELDKRIDKLKEENKGLVDKALKAVADLAKAIIRAVLTPIKTLLEALIGDVASKVIDAIIDDPEKFMKNLFKGIGNGIKNFASNIGKHLLNGLVTWLFGNIGAELKLPETFDLKGFLDILLQILGLTKDYIFGLVEQILGTNVVELIKFIIDFILKNGADSLKVLWDLVKMIGEVGIDAIMFLITEGVDAITSLPEKAQNAFKSFGSVETILGFAESLIGSLGEGVLELVGGLAKGAKFLFDFFSTLFTQGITATWDLLKSSLGTLKEIFMGDLTKMLISEVVQQGVLWLISILIPGAGVLKAAKAIFDVINFFIERKDEIKAFLDSILNTLKSIINGDIGAMAKAIEDALAMAIPTVLGFLASLLGIGGIPSKIKKFFTKLREPITKIVNGIFNKAKAFFKGIGQAAKKGYKKAKKAVKKGFKKAKNAVKSAFKGGKTDQNKKKDKEPKDSAKARIKAASTETQGLVKNTRDPQQVNNQLSGIASKHKLHKLKLNKKGKKKYQIVGKTQRIKAQRQAEPGASFLPLPGVATDGFQQSGRLTTVQLEKENPWQNPKNKVIVKSKVKGSKKKANFTLTGKLLAQSQILKKVAAKLKKLVKKKVDYKSVNKKLPALQQQYELKSLTVTSVNKDKTQYQIVGEAPPEGSTNAQREVVPGAVDTIATDGVEESIQRSQGQGQELARTVRSPMEDAFGFDFGNVRIHTDTEGDRLSRSLEARAFTSGSDIFFRQGTYAPESPSGKRLLAHELTHVVQQSSESPQVTPSNPLLSYTVQRVSEHAPYFVQREAEGNSDPNAELKKAESRARGAAVVGAGIAIGSSLLSSGDKGTPQSTHSISKNKLTMKVTIQKPPQQKKKTLGAGVDQALPDDLVHDIVKLIQQIVNQYPNPDIVQKKLDKVCVDFDLQLLKVVGSATIGTSISYEIQIKGRPQQPTAEKTDAIAKNLDNLTPKQEEAKSEGGLFGSLFSNNSKSKPEAKAKETTLTKAPEQPAKDQKAKPEKLEKENVKPEKAKQTVEIETKEKKATEELKEEASASQPKSPKDGRTEKSPLDVNTKVKRIDPATVEISVRADPKKK